MRVLPLLLVLGSLASAASLAAQERDAQVLRAGELRFEVGADFVRAATGFGGVGTTISPQRPPLDLTDVTFPPLAPLSTDLLAFLEATGGASSPAPLTAGAFSADYVSSVRRVPIGIAVGILPRLEVGAILPIHRAQLQLTRASLVDGNVGINPSPTENAALLGTIDPAWETLGRAPLLPVATTAAGIELQQRVQDVTGMALTLPGSPLTAPELLATFPLDPFPGSVGAWQPGDLELHARVQLLSNLGAPHYPPAEAGVRYRLAAEAAARIATGEPSDTLAGFGVAPEAGATGVRLGGAGDLFLGERFWLTGLGSWTSLSVEEADVAPPAWYPSLPWAVPGEAERTIVRLAAVPRVRLTRDISLGASAEYWRETIDGASAISRTEAGFAFRYSTHPSREAGSSIAPAEVSIGYSGTIARTEGTPDIGTLYLRASIFPRLWGRGLPAP